MGSTENNIELPDCDESTASSKVDITDEHNSDEIGVKNEVNDTCNSEGDNKKELDIIRQVEYYFGDNNLLRDKFLRQEIKKDENGWVPLSVILTFKRLASMCSDSDYVAECLTKSTAGIIEVSEDKTKIRRNPERPMPEYNEECRKEIMSRTVYVKGFPLTSDLDALLEFFKSYDKVVNVQMRKYLNKPTKTTKFKGSVFITFQTKEQAEKFLANNEVSYNNVKLICKWQEKYFIDKSEERKIKVEKQDKKHEKKQDKKQDNKQEKDKQNEKHKLEEIEFAKGSVISIGEISDEITREDIREALNKIDGIDEIAYIDFRRGADKGNIRFSNEDSAKKLIEKLEDSKLKIKDMEVTVRALTSEEEEAYFVQTKNNIKNARQNPRRKGKRRNYANNDRKDAKKKKPTDE